MKPNKQILLGISTLAAGLIFAPPLFAQTNSSSTTATTAPANNGAPNTSTTTTTTTTTNNNGGATEAVKDAAHDVKTGTVNAYHDVKGTVKDTALEAKVKAMLHENKDTRNADVHVEANNGVVTLTGTVGSKLEAIRAEQIAANVYGVKSVRDHLTYPAGEGSAANQ